MILIRPPEVSHEKLYGSRLRFKIHTHGVCGDVDKVFPGSSVGLVCMREGTDSLCAIPVVYICNQQIVIQGSKLW